MKILTIFKQVPPGKPPVKHAFLTSLVLCSALSTLLAPGGAAAGGEQKAPVSKVPNKNAKISAVKSEEAPDKLPNFHTVHEYLYRGGEPSDAGIKRLKEMGITTVIDLRAMTDRARHEKAEVEKQKMEYINLPMSSKAPTEKQVDTLLASIDSARKNGGKVFVHCAHGSDRTGCMVGIWRVTRDGWSWERTYKEMRKYYFGPKYKELAGAVESRVPAPEKEAAGNTHE